MPEYYVKYKWPEEALGIDIEYEGVIEWIEKSERVELFITDHRGCVMVFQSEQHAKAQIAHEQQESSEFKRWASDFKIIKGEEV